MGRYTNPIGWGVIRGHALCSLLSALCSLLSALCSLLSALVRRSQSKMNSSTDDDDDAEKDNETDENNKNYSSFEDDDPGDHSGDDQGGTAATGLGLGLGGGGGGGGPSGGLGRAMARESIDRDFGSFEQNTKGIGLKLLKKMGYVPGTGLGKDGMGIVNPIHVKIRPVGMGIGHGGFNEKVNENENEKDAYLPGDQRDDQGDQGDQRGRWKKAGIKARKPLYKLASEVIREEMAAGATPVTADPITASTKIRDLRGEEEIIFTDMNAFSSASSKLKLSSKTGVRFPELSHNINLIAAISKKDLLYISRQIKMEQAARETRLEHLETSTSLLLADKTALDRTLILHSLVSDILRISKIHSKDLTDPSSVDDSILGGLLGPLVSQIVAEYPREFLGFHIDHLVCGLVAAVVKSRIKAWMPLEEPLRFAYLFSEWNLLLKGNGSRDVDVGEMSALESVLYSVWLPRVRQAVNNDWNPQDPEKLIEMLEFYTSHQILPQWFLAHLIHHLILPKLTRYLDEYKISHKDDLASHKIHVWLFPWLPLMGESAMQPLWKTVRRKLQTHLTATTWANNPSPILALYETWSQVWIASDQESFLTTTILPHLVIHMRHTFIINPCAQDLAPLLAVLFWRTIIPSHLLSHLLETEFFPGWHRCLWQWLASPAPDLDEISAWYGHWKGLFVEMGLERLEACRGGFKRGLDMMNQGVSETMGTLRQKSDAFIPTPSVSVSVRADDVVLSFKDMVAQVFAEQSLEFVPMGKRHATNGKELFRLGKKVWVYIEDGVLFCGVDGSGGEYRFMSVDDAVELAKR